MAYSLRRPGETSPWIKLGPAVRRFSFDPEKLPELAAKVVEREVAAGEVAEGDREATAERYRELYQKRLDEDEKVACALEEHGVAVQVFTQDTRDREEARRLLVSAQSPAETLEAERFALEKGLAGAIGFEVELGSEDRAAFFDALQAEGLGTLVASVVREWNDLRAEERAAFFTAEQED